MSELTHADVLTLQEMLRDAGFYNGLIDGIRGPKTRAAEAAYESAKSGKPSWPRNEMAELRAFYGAHEIGDDGRPTSRWESKYLVGLEPQFRMVLAWDTDAIVRKIRCHKLVAPSLSRVLQRIWDKCGRDQRKVEEIRAHLFGGCFNYRPIRGGSRLSCHAWGAAIDLDPDRNGLGRVYKPNSGMMDPIIIEAFNAEGWQWGGEWKRPDAMHFEATSI